MSLITRGFDKTRRWLAARATVDRILALIGILASVVLGVLGILTSMSKTYFVFALIVTFLLVVLICAPLVVLLRARPRRLRLHPYPYKIALTQFTTDITDATGRIAVLRHEEDIECLQEHMVAVRRAYWGDWDDPLLSDLCCLTPKDARPVDIHKEGYQTVFIVSLRHIFNFGDRFRATTELTVRNGFCNPEREYTSWSITAPIDVLLFRVILPRGKVFIPGTATLRFGVSGSFDELSLPDATISWTEDGRQQMVWRESEPQRHYTYGIHWMWREQKLPDIL
jgi:hypothetical protein